MQYFSLRTFPSHAPLFSNPALSSSTFCWCYFFSPHLFCLPAGDQQQPVDAAVFHLVPPHSQFLRAEYVRRRGGGELSQVPAAPGGRGGQAEGGEEAQANGEEETE